MKREHRKLTAAELRLITSKRPVVVRKIRPPAQVPCNTARSPGPNSEERPTDWGEAENEERKNSLS